MPNNLYIKAFESISALGNSATAIWENYSQAQPLFSEKKMNNKNYWVSSLTLAQEEGLRELQQLDKRYRLLDPSVLQSLYLAKKLHQNTKIDWTNTGINIGSSRGATTTFEASYHDFLTTGKVPSLTSPITTLGNISSWVAQELNTEGPCISHSITCSTALHALLNAKAWLHSGMAESFVFGGTEAPLTPYTIAQMKALKLYSKSTSKWACESLAMEKKSNSLVLGQAASLFVVDTKPENALAKIAGVGFATEKIQHNIAISKEAECFQKSMKMALNEANLKQVDAIVMHAPGTVKGDLAELKAIEKSFDQRPFLTTNKFMIGHSFGASGGMSLEMAILMLQHQQLIENPFYKNQNSPKEIKNIMVNAVGFGGNACSVIVGL